MDQPKWWKHLDRLPATPASGSRREVVAAFEDEKALYGPDPGGNADRLDVDIVAAFKDLAGPDGSYQTLINRALREWLDAGSVRGLVEDTLVSLIIGMRDEGISEEALADIVMRMRERNNAHG